MCRVIKFQDFPVDREPEFHVGGIYELCVAIERIGFYCQYYNTNIYGRHVD